MFLIFSFKINGMNIMEILRTNSGTVLVCWNFCQANSNFFIFKSYEGGFRDGKVHGSGTFYNKDK